MSAIERVLSLYEKAEEALRLKKYSDAAKYFRQCYLTYETGELPVYNEKVKIVGTNALQEYQLILEEYLSFREKERFMKEDDAFGGLEEQFGC